MDERELWVLLIGPDPDSDQLYGLQCPECGESIEAGDEEWFERVAFCRGCIETARSRSEQSQVSVAEGCSIVPRPYLSPRMVRLLTKHLQHEVRSGPRRIEYSLRDGEFVRKGDG